MEELKKCKDCFIEKDKSLFYKAQNECKECTKNRVRKRESVLKNDPKWVEKEKDRAREKYYRLGYKDLHKPTPENKAIAIKKHRDKYPEKYFAKNASYCLSTKVKGNHLHHWSYNQEHYKDVIELSVKEHNKLHRFIVYDQERMMYRKLDGELLDTKEKHLAYCDFIQKNKS